MFEKPSLMLRIAIGKSIGFLFGLIGLSFYPCSCQRRTGCSAGGSCCGIARWGQLSGCSGFYLSPGIQIAIPLVVSRTAYGGLDEFRADLLCL